MKPIFFITFAFCLLAGCEDDYQSPDLENRDLLPKREDYLSRDYGTQALAAEIQGVFNSRISMVYYDSKTRTIPQLYLTRGQHDINVKALKSGAVEVSFEKFSTDFMPLQLTVNIKTLLEEKDDTIFMHGTDGIIRTSDDSGKIGVPLPESDDGELTGFYLPSAKTMKIWIDLMLPIPVKAWVSEGIKQ